MKKLILLILVVPILMGAGCNKKSNLQNCIDECKEVFCEKYNVSAACNLDKDYNTCKESCIKDHE